MTSGNSPKGISGSCTNPKGGELALDFDFPYILRNQSLNYGKNSAEKYHIETAPVRVKYSQNCMKIKKFGSDKHFSLHQGTLQKEFQVINISHDTRHLELLVLSFLNDSLLQCFKSSRFHLQIKTRRFHLKTCAHRSKLISKRLT